MGSGDFSGNQSVHWKITHDDSTNAQPAAKGVDDLQNQGFDAIGCGSNGQKTHKGDFAVTLRFDSEDACRKALQDAIASIRRHHHCATATVRVRAINRESATTNPPSEVRIDW